MNKSTQTKTEELLKDFNEIREKFWITECKRLEKELKEQKADLKDIAKRELEASLVSRSNELRDKVLNIIDKNKPFWVPEDKLLFEFLKAEIARVFE